MSKFTDPNFLKTDQYRDASNLNARIEIHRRFSTNPQGWYQWIFTALEKLPQKARVLELGCGTGSMWAACPERIPVGWDITLSDLSPGMLDAAWRNLVGTARSYKFEQFDAQSIPYPDESFDIVIANHMLYHVPDRAKALGEIQRVLRSPDPAARKPGGFLVATTVGEHHLEELNEWLRRVSDGKFEPFANPFTLENGLPQLTPFFPHISILRYPDDLRITEIPPLITYIRATVPADELSESALAETQADLQKRLALLGELFVRKDTGLFLAVK